jgi:hypothetical protein
MVEKNEFGYRTDRGWRFSDLYTLQVVSHSPTDLIKVRDDYLGAFRPDSPAPTHPTGLGTVSGQQQTQARTGLVVKLAATHAGLITRNNGFYMPDKMRAAVGSWTEHYNKPIQIHHNDSPGDSHDPVGRVIAARYVDTSIATIDRFQNSILRDGFNKEVGTADKKFWDAFISDKTSFIKKLEMMRLMDSVLNDTHYQGVGYIELTANITDPVAIQKVLDGRYLTGSVGAVSDKAVCSTCNTDWLEEEHCGHRPGRVYDGKKCVVVAGNLEYDEYSFVNVPADRHSSLLGIEHIQNAVQDSTDRVVKYFTVFNDSKEDSTMSDNKSEIIKDSAVVTPESTQDPALPKVAADAPADIADAIAVDQVVEPSIDDQLSLLLDRLLSDNKLSDEEHEKLYELQLADMDQDVIADAKLSTASRKKLAKSTFCGPDRSFPVPDCAHVTAARRLVGRYKGPGDKSTILACVARKAKAMGCTSNSDAVKSQDAQVQDSTQQDVVATPSLSDKPLSVSFVIDGLAGTEEEKLNTINTILDSMTALGSELVTKAIVAKGLAADLLVNSEIKQLEDEVVKNEEIIGDLRDQLIVLRKELKAAYEDVITVEDQLIVSREAVRAAKADKVNLLHTLDGSLSDAIKESVLALTDEALDTTINALSAKVDINKIADRLNNGLSRIPDEIVEVPAGLTEPTAEIKPTNKPTYATQQMVDEVYRRTLLSQGHAAAQAFYSDAVKRGLANPRE